MANPFTLPSISGFNANPPTDDGAQTAANEVEWQKHLDKIGTPLKVHAEQLGTNTQAAFNTIVSGGGELTAETALASGATTDVLGAASFFVSISGTGTITSLGTGANRFRFVRFTDAATLTHNATSLILPGAANITTAAGDTMVLVSDASSNARVVAYQRKGGVSLHGSGGHVFGLTLSNNATDADHDIDIAIGEAASDDANPVLMRLASARTKQLDAAWAVGTDQGGLDTGSIAIDTWYYVYLIMRSDTGVVDVLFSTSASSPTMPTNYDYKRRLPGAIRTDGSANILGFVQAGRRFTWKTDPALSYSSTTLGTSADTSATPLVPTGIKSKAYYRCNGSTGGSAAAVRISDPDTDDVAPSVLAAPLGDIVVNASVTVAMVGTVITSSTGTIRLRASAASTTFRLLVTAWEDYLA